MASGVSGKGCAAILGATALLGIGGGAMGALLSDVPSPDQLSIRQGQAPTITIADPGDVLSPEDEQRLRDYSEQRLDNPDVVNELYYVVFAHNRENVADNVEEHLGQHAPHLLDYEADSFADGSLIVALGLDPRMNGIFYGEDVGAVLHLSPGSDRDTHVVDAMKPGVKDGNIASGLFASADAAMDIEAAQNYVVEQAEDERDGNAMFAGAAGAGLGALGSGTYVAVASRRKRNLKQARDDYDAVTREYADLAQRLDEIDIRANSVSSAFADQELRKQWGEVRDRFNGYHQLVSGAGGIGDIDIADDKQALKHRKQLRETAESVEHASTAEDNINRLFLMEQGDAATRRASLTEIRADVLSAKMDVHDRQLERELQNLYKRIDALDADPDSPTFIDDFVRVLGDYRILLEQVKKKEFSDVKEYEPLRAPAIYEPNYRHTGFVTYSQMNVWHSNNVERHRQEQASSSSSSSSSSASFSSGFGGSGSTSRF